MSATRSSWRIAAIRAKIRLQGAGKEDFDMLKLFAGTLVVLSLAAIGANAAETGTKTMPDSSIYPPRTHHRPMYNYVRHHHYCYLPSGRCGNNHRVVN
jgi:hypothetical protein